MLRDEMDANLKSYKLENEMLREKLTVLKQEYYKMVYLLLTGKQPKGRLRPDES